MHVLLDPIVRSPKFPEYLRELNAYWRDLEARRAAFIERISPHDKAEFIHGVEVWHSPARVEQNDARDRLFDVLRAWVRLNKLGKVTMEKALCDFGADMFEPDIAFFRTAKAAALQRKSLVYPVPDLIVEVLSPSTEANDRQVKYGEYALHGVQEYWLVDPDRLLLEQHVLRDGRFSLVNEPINGEVASVVLAGLKFPVALAFDDAVLEDWLECFGSSHSNATQK